MVILSCTFEVISVRAQFSGDTDGNATARIQYRRSAGDTGWHQAYAPYIDRRPTIGGMTNPYANEARVSIVGLAANTSYDVEVTWSDPDGVAGGQPRIVSVSTLSYTPPTGGTTITVSGDASLASALNRVSPGQTIHLNAGTYSPFNIRASGTPSAWIVIEGDADGRTVVSGVGVNQNILVNGNYLVVQGLTLGPSDSSGIVLTMGQHHVFIQDNVLENISTHCAADPSHHYGDGGVTIGDKASNIYVLRNTIRSVALSAPACTLNPIYDSPGAGVQWTNATTLIVKDNIVTGGFRDAITSDNSYDAGVDVDLTGNTVSGYKDDGIESKGGNVHVRVWANAVAADAGNTCIAGNTNTTTNLYGPLYIFRNTCLVTTSNPIGTTTFKLNPVVPMFLFHNSIDSSLAPQKWDTYVITGGPAVVMNNIAKSSGSMVDYAPSTATFDYNLAVVTTGASYAYKWNGRTTYDTFEAFQKKTGQEAHGLNADPLFSDIALHIEANSPAIDSGVDIANFNSSDSAWPYSGSAPDMGALEWTGASKDPRGR